MNYKDLMLKIDEYKKSHLNKNFKNNETGVTVKVIDLKVIDIEMIPTNRKYEKLDLERDNSDILIGDYFDFEIRYKPSDKMQTYDKSRMKFNEEFTIQS